MSEIVLTWTVAIYGARIYMLLKLPALAEQEHRGLLKPWQSIFINCAVQDNLRSLLVGLRFFSHTLWRL